MSDKPVKTIDNMRGVRYGEVLCAYVKGDAIEIEVWGTQMLNDCPQHLWDGLDPEAIKTEMGAVFARLNGPRYWVLDGLGTKVATVEPTLREFNGLLMRRIATIPLGTGGPAGQPYTVRNVDRGAQFFWDKGKRIYELVDPDGRAFVMQALCVAVDKDMNDEKNLVSLGERLSLPAGWSYRTRILDGDIYSDTTKNLATVVQDEFENTYTLPG